MVKAVCRAQRNEPYTHPGVKPGHVVMLNGLSFPRDPAATSGGPAPSTAGGGDPTDTRDSKRARADSDGTASGTALVPATGPLLTAPATSGMPPAPAGSGTALPVSGPVATAPVPSRSGTTGGAWTGPSGRAPAAGVAVPMVASGNRPSAGGPRSTSANSAINQGVSSAPRMVVRNPSVRRQCRGWGEARACRVGHGPTAHGRCH